MCFQIFVDFVWHMVEWIRNVTYIMQIHLFCFGSMECVTIAMVLQCSNSCFLCWICVEHFKFRITCECMNIEMVCGLILMCAWVNVVLCEIYIYFWFLMWSWSYQKKLKVRLLLQHDLLCLSCINHVWWSATCNHTCRGFVLRGLFHLCWKHCLWSMYGNSVDSHVTYDSILKNFQWFQNHETIYHKLFDGWFKLFNY